MSQHTDTDQIPKTLQAPLEQLVESLKSDWADILISIVLFGDAARGEGFAIGHGPVNVAIILREVFIEELDKIAPLIREANREFGLATMIQTIEELNRSTDVFPIKFANMQQHHVLLYGEDVLSTLTISTDHLRLRCEQQLKNLNLRLRAFYIQRSTGASELRATLETSSAAFFADLETLLKLKTGKSPQSQAEIIEAASTEFGLPKDALMELLWLRRSNDAIAPTELKQKYATLMQAVQKAAQIVDQL